MHKDDAVWNELVEAAEEVKYKSQRLKNALAAVENVRKTASFADKKKRVPQERKIK